MAINYAKITSYPTPVLPSQFHSYGSIPYSSPITFVLEYDVTTPVFWALPTNDQIQHQGNASMPVFRATLHTYKTYSDATRRYTLGTEEVRFEENRAELTFSPKEVFERFCAERLPELSSDDRYFFNQDIDTYRKNILVSLQAPALVGNEVTDLWSNESYLAYTPEQISGWESEPDICVPPIDTLYGFTTDNHRYVGENVLINSGGMSMITLSATFPPTEVKLSQTSAAPGQTVWLSWSGAEPGESNDIVGYEIYRSTNVNADEFVLLTSISSTETSGTVAVTAPATKGASYYYKVVTVGSADGYNSAKSAVYAKLICDYSMCLAPTKVTIDGASNVEPGAPIVVRWEGASAGENNTIAGYMIRYSDTVDGVQVGLGIGQLKLWGGTFDTFGSEDSFTAPTENGTTYYFRVKTLGTVDGTDSDWSEAYAAVTCTYSSVNAPTKVTVGGAKSVYAAPGDTVLLEWAGASAGANNQITGFDILRDGEVYIAGLLPTESICVVPAHDTTGNAYRYSVVAKGQYADSAPSAAATVYSYTNPTAPTTVEVSASESYVGGRVELSWSGAAVGGFNDIVGYRVYVSDTVNGKQTLVATVASTETSASCYVDAPGASGGVSYFRVVTIGSYSESASSDYVTVTASGDAGADSEITVIVKPKVVSKRRMILGDYDTARDGQWTLTGWSFEEPEVQTSYVTIPWHGLGGLDMSTVLTNGDPRYNRRTLTATFECSEGTREDRNLIISKMVNKLHGQRLDIVLPDDPARYIVGRVSVLSVYSDMAHASVEITANCEPWRYNKTETNIELLVTENPRTDVLCNNGRKVLVPELTVSGYSARVNLTSGGISWVLTPGKYRLPDLVLPSGSTVLTYSGSGTVVITYREAIL